MIRWAPERPPRALSRVPGPSVRFSFSSIPLEAPLTLHFSRHSVSFPASCIYRLIAFLEMWPDVALDECITEQIGGGRRSPSPVIQTPTRLRTRIKTTARDTGLVRGAQGRRAMMGSDSIAKPTESTATSMDSRPYALRPPQAIPSASSALVAPSRDYRAQDTHQPSSPYLSNAIPDAVRMHSSPAIDEPSRVFSGGPPPDWSPGSRELLASQQTTVSPPRRPSLLPTAGLCALRVPSDSQVGSRGSDVTELCVPPRAPSVGPPASNWCSQERSASRRPSILHPPRHPSLPLQAGPRSPSGPSLRAASDSPHAVEDDHPASFLESSDQFLADPNLSTDRLAPLSETLLPSTPMNGRRSNQVLRLLQKGYDELEGILERVAEETTMTTQQVAEAWHRDRGRTINGPNYWNRYQGYWKANEAAERDRVGVALGEPGMCIASQRFSDTHEIVK